MNSISDPPKRAFVFLARAGAWTPVALLEVGLQREGRPHYSFSYGRKWRARADAFPLDPVHLPLDSAIEPSPRMFGALLDSGPDRWGNRLLDERFAEKARPPTILDRLLLAGDDRAGALAFGPTADAPVLRPAMVPIRDLAAVEEAMVRFDAGERLEPDLAVLANGTSLGGARPKATVRRTDGGLWLAKFRRKADAIDVVRAEHATMTLAAAAGLRVADTEVVSLGANREALLVRRFDRCLDDRRPYLSALSLTGRAETDVGGGYPEIADAMRPHQVGSGRADLVELYRRMVFNVAIGNTDDHLKNHGFLRAEGGWTLSPAFDVVPTVDGDDFQAISVGRMGTTPSRANLLSECGRFGLGAEDASAITARILEVTARWREHFAACGVPDADLRVIGRRVGRL
ncbi:MAG: type II toxin-antitoxin system HipA family toxin [Alphaproteobacteria bacterium]|nr:type II toxin-antitoxin system HipA family toxin [Alphaproteobacteria bacterium]MBF0335972.1 type II toxin-antitoxin system HipA family toxin [Alphaproteobacteria bacterium]